MKRVFIAAKFIIGALIENTDLKVDRRGRIPWLDANNTGLNLWGWSEIILSNLNKINISKMITQVS